MEENGRRWKKMEAEKLVFIHRRAELDDDLVIVLELSGLPSVELIHDFGGYDLPGRFLGQKAAVLEDVRLVAEP
jgi:hypothetical protein